MSSRSQKFVVPHAGERGLKYTENRESIGSEQSTLSGQAQPNTEVPHQPVTQNAGETQQMPVNQSEVQ